MDVIIIIVKVSMHNLHHYFVTKAISFSYYKAQHPLIVAPKVKLYIYIFLRTCLTRCLWENKNFSSYCKFCHKGYKYRHCCKELKRSIFEAHLGELY